ncbi:MAG: hypothetical protein RSB97_01735 [Christensenella sp.]
MRNKVLAVLVILFGALSFLIFVPQTWWLGLACAIVGVIMGSATLKTLHTVSVIGVLLSITSCIIYIFMMGAAGLSIFS